MAKAKIVMTIELEYEVNPREYKGATTPEECLLIDVQGLKYDPSNIFDDSRAKVTVKGEIIPDEPQDGNQLALDVVDGSFVAPQVAL
ncbi:hypothetical protein D3C75_783520 [compost metagenome]